MTCPVCARTAASTSAGSGAAPDTINRTGDSEGCRRHDDGSVTTPRGFKEAYRQLVEGGWIAISAGIDFALAEVRQPVIETARRTGLLATIGEDHTYLTIDEAVRSLGQAHDPA